MRVLIRLLGGFGLGDTVQHSIVLKHLAKYRPDWIVDVQGSRGAHAALRGLCNAVWHHDEKPTGPYDSTIELHLQDVVFYDPGCPATKAVWCLSRSFGIDYDPSLGRYEVRVSDAATRRIDKYLRTIAKPDGNGKFNTVLIHYQGSSTPNLKNLEHWQAKEICDAALRAGRVPIILDWDARSPLPNGTIVNPPRALWGDFGNGDAELIAAMIRASEAYIGVDSGPGKIASSTDTPTLICWTNHHPMQFHNPAGNTTHLVRADWQGTAGCFGIDGAEEFFKETYRYFSYRGQHGLVGEACRWLGKELKDDCYLRNEIPGVVFIIPPGMRSAAWVLAKIRNIAGIRPIGICVSGDEEESFTMLKRQSFVNFVKHTKIPVHTAPEKPVNTRGHTLFVSDGVRDGYHYLIPDTVFQTGRPISEWLPDVPIDEEMAKEVEEYL